MEGLFENGDEVTASLSGGGFSNYFDRPNYQAEAVSNYLKLMAGNLPDQSKWNSTGRAYPDVAAQAFNFIIVQNLIPLPGVAGTSCAAPTFAGVISLLNDLRLQNGKPPLGFLNPLLVRLPKPVKCPILTLRFQYQIANEHPTVFTDIVKGSNPVRYSYDYFAPHSFNSFVLGMWNHWFPCNQGLGSCNWFGFTKLCGICQVYLGLLAS